MPAPSSTEPVPPESPALLRCVFCGWIYYAAAEGEEALDRCFNCKSFAFETAEPDAAPRGVTLLPVRWPPIKRGATVPKDKLTAAMIERPVWPKP